MEYRIYARISKEEIEKGDKIYLNQISVMEEHFKQNNLGYEYHLYEDEGRSGTSIDGRIGYQNMVQDIKNGVKFTPCIMALDRLNRNVHNAIHFYELLNENKLDLFCITNPIEIWAKSYDNSFLPNTIPSSTGYFNYVLFNLLADNESRTLSMRTLIGLGRRQRRKGQSKATDRKKYEHRKNRKVNL